MRKVKQSRTHKVDYECGWQATEFKGGRSKLMGSKKGNRAWWMWRVCLCKGNKHTRPHPEDWTRIDEDGNPTRKFRWDPVCPLATLEFVFQCQLEEDVPPRCYPNFVEKTTRRPARYGNKNIAYPSVAALDWMENQGLPRFDSHSGRKSLARICKKLKIPYRLSVHIHGDLFEVWNENYEENAEGKVSIRKQSRDPQVATAALRVFAGYVGRGFDPYEAPMTLLERQNDMLISLLATPKIAARIRMGLPVVDSDEEEQPPKKRKRRRVPAVKKEEFVKKEESDSDGEESSSSSEDAAPAPKKRAPAKRKRKAASSGKKPKKKRR